MTVINTNIKSLVSQNALNRNSRDVSLAMEQLSTGKRINYTKTVKGLGKCVAVIPEDEFFRLQRKYGHQEVHSREFLRYFNKKFPHLSPNRA